MSRSAHRASAPLRSAVEPLERRTLLASVPSGFADAAFATGLSNPTAMAFAPDGRIFVTQQGGALRVVKNGATLATPFLSLSVDPAGERGLLGLAFDPDFSTNRHLYVYYTVPVSGSVAVHNRISRFTASSTNPDVVAAGSELVLAELDPLSGATNHNGGALSFGPDGKLYAAVGENATPSHSQTLANRHGKMLRLNKDGSIPTDNPFFGTATGGNRSIWALGLRNPFTFSFQPGTGRMFINDVGDNGPDAEKWEEINEGAAGRNFGWPTSGDGYFDPATYPSFTNPLHAYNHTTGGRAITGGAFYNPATPQFPAEYAGDYFFADYAGGFVKKLEAPATGSRLASTPFATGISAPVDLDVGPDGALYYLARGAGTIGRIRYTQSLAPAISSQPASATVGQGGSATFTVSASGDPPLSYQWQRNGANIPGATAASYTVSSATAADSGARFRAVVTNAFGSATSSEATLTVLSNAPPTATIAIPPAGSTFRAGDAIAFSGSGSDAEDGPLAASALTWRVDYVTGGLVRPFVAPFTGTGGSFTVPTTTPYTEPDVSYRISLTATDSAGLATTVTRDVLPLTSRVTLATSPAGLPVQLDGQPQASPYAFTGVEGIVRSIGAPQYAASGGRVYQFSGWSDGGARVHDVSTPTADTTYTATYVQSDRGLTATYFNNIDLTGTTVTRTDADVNFDWGTGSPDAAIGADTFSARWAGQIQPLYGETYTFHTTSDDGVRLTVNGVRVIDNWTDHAPTTNTGTITLAAGQRYDLVMEYFENGGGAVAKLEWSSASQGRQVVPTSQLYAAAAPRVPVVYQAEAATVVGARVLSNHAGYTGTGFVDYQGASGDYVQWSVNAAAAGSYRLDVRYANAGGSRPLALRVNGTVVSASLAFAGTGSWSAWSTVSVTVNLAAGANHVRLTAIGSSGPNLDALTVT